jgi:alkyl hydroperoxide reductase subunit D
MTQFTLEALRDLIPASAQDVRMNLQAVLGESFLSVAQRYGVALACAVAARSKPLRLALAAETLAQTGPEVVEDATAAATLMGMNNIIYRFRHMIDKESYIQAPTRLRTSHLDKPATNKADFELFALAVSAVNGCESCVRAHERAVLQAGISEAQVTDAIRIAATIYGAAVLLETVQS